MVHHRAHKIQRCTRHSIYMSHLCTTAAFVIGLFSSPSEGHSGDLLAEENNVLNTVTSQKNSLQIISSGLGMSSRRENIIFFNDRKSNKSEQGGFLVREMDDAAKTRRKADGLDADDNVDFLPPFFQFGISWASGSQQRFGSLKRRIDSPNESPTLQAPLEESQFSVGGGHHPRTSGLLGASNMGWTPDAYPNPSTDPTKCRISAVVSKPSEANPMSGGKDLLLCDPDAVLEDSYMEKIADAVRNFTFSVPSSHFLPCFRDAMSARQPPPAPTIHSQSGEGVTQEKVDVATDDGWIVSEGYEASSADSMAPIQIAVAVVSKIDLQSFLRANLLYAYEDENDMINDAARYFATYLHDAWQVGSDACGQTGILVFLSIKDRVCYISTGAVVEAVIPWWRLEYVVNDMKSDLRRRRYGDAVLRAVDDMRYFLEQGPPTFQDRAKDFVKRFGVVIAFAFFTFAFTLWGEYRERFRRWQYTERRSRLTHSEKIQAKILQESYRCKACPICLEEFACKEISGAMKPAAFKTDQKEQKTVDKAVATLGVEIVPTVGSDGLPLKLLRCGHVFDQTCWRIWVNKGQGNPYKCPVCRQDIGPKKAAAGGSGGSSSRFSIASTYMIGDASPPPTAATALNRPQQMHPNYDSMNMARTGRRERNRRDRALRFFRMNYSSLTPQQHIPVVDQIYEEQLLLDNREVTLGDGGQEDEGDEDGDGDASDSRNERRMQRAQSISYLTLEQGIS